MAYRDKFDMEPLRIRAHLRTGIIGDRHLPLDGVILYQAHRYQAGNIPPMTIPGDYSTQGISTLPLAIEHPGRRQWYYLCSWAQWSHDIEARDYWNKRFDASLAYLVDLGRRSKISQSSGQYKQYHMPIFYRPALWVEWYCVGDKAQIECLLCTLTHLGKKRSQGWGRVRRWEIESCSKDWSVWKEEKLMRGVPEGDVDDVSNYEIQTYGIRPSYWKSNNQMPLVMPNG